MKKLVVALVSVLLAVFMCVLLLILLDKDQPAPPVKEKIVWRELNAKKIFEEVNKVRAEAGVPLLQESPELYVSAQNKCDDMVQYNAYEHTNSKTGYRGVDYIFVQLPGADRGGENLANSDFQSERDVINGWYKSTHGHKEAMLNSRFNAGGTAICQLPYSSEHTRAVVLHLAGL